VTNLETFKELVYYNIVEESLVTGLWDVCTERLGCKKSEKLLRGIDIVGR